MPRLERLAAGQRTAWTAWIAPLGMAAALLLTLVAGLACLWLHRVVAVPEIVLAPAGIILLLACLAQGKLACDGWHNGRLVTRDNPLHARAFWAALAAGCFIAYLAALAIGPLAYVAAAWLAACAVWYTLLLLPLSASPQAVEHWRTWTWRRGPRRARAMIYGLSLLLIGCEALLESLAIAQRSGWWLADSPTAAADVDAWTAATGDTGAAGERPPGSRRFRVAILASPGTLAHAERGGYLGRVRQSLPGLELVPIALDPGAVRRPAEVAAPLTAHRADLALALVPACDDLSPARGESNWFDARQFELGRLMFGQSATPAADPQAAPVAADEFERLVHSLAPQLAACRTPIDEPMQCRWQRGLESLEIVVEGCRRSEVPLALLLVPSEVQVNSAVRDAVVRRMGCTAAQFDFDLPQRRLTGFAEQRGVATLDLLPHLRLSRAALYEPNTTRWNAEGHALAASALGGWLQSQYGTQLAVAARVSIAH